MKKINVLITLLFIAMMSMVLMPKPVFAIPDDRYQNFSGLGTLWHTGSWNDFAPIQSARHSETITFNNDFDLDKVDYYESITMWCEVGEDMVGEGREFTMRVWAGPKAQNIGVRMSIEPSDMDFRATIVWGDIAETYGYTKFVLDYTDYYYLLDFKVAFEKTVDGNGDRQYIASAKFYLYPKDWSTPIYLGPR